MSNISIIIGTMLGASEYVADRFTELLAAEHQITHYLTPDLAQFNLNKEQIWIICTSTHGAGDFPENMLNFVEQLNQQTPDLSKIKYAVCGLGDSNYDTFCQAGKTIDQQLDQLGATQLIKPLLIDVSLGDLPEDNAEIWLNTWSDRLK